VFRVWERTPIARPGSGKGILIQLLFIYLFNLWFLSLSLGIVAKGRRSGAGPREPRNDDWFIGFFFFFLERPATAVGKGCKPGL
jgi:hypothetical protein